MEDVQSGFARGGEEKTCFRLINVRVYSIADGKRLENLAAVGIHDGKHLVAAADEEAAMLDVHFHGGCASRRSGWPGGLVNFCWGMQGDHLVFILQSVLCLSLSLMHRVFR